MGSGAQHAAMTTPTRSGPRSSTSAWPAASSTRSWPAPSSSRPSRAWPSGSWRSTVNVVCCLQLPTSSTSRRGGYSYGFDLRLDPISLDHLGALKRLSTEELGLEESQQTVDPTGKDVGN